MTVRLSRRALIAGALGSIAGAALADAPLVSLRPAARPGSVMPPTGAGILARAGLGGQAGLALVDADSGDALDLVNAGAPLPPASVTKVLTALYARDRLGPGHRFVTRLIGTGPVSDGVLAGDLVLAGGGDPVLLTDDLARLVQAARTAGLRSVQGRFLVWGGALPYVHDIDPGQLPHLGYNPALGGLNLNFNRVHFEWALQGGEYRVTMDARSDTMRPAVAVSRMRVEARDQPVYTYEDAGGADDWTVARSALGEGGSRWLPVRKPALYAGDVFRTLAQAQGITLTPAEEIADLPDGAEISRLESPPLDRIIADMLEYSTNLTAEVLGLSATRSTGAQPADLAQSAAAMRHWVRDSLGVRGHFVDHSGLGEGTTITALDLAIALARAAGDGALIGSMKEIVLLDEDGDALPHPPAVVRAKTGTLNFVSALAGYIVAPGGRRMAFAILTSDPERRAEARLSADEIPPGTRDWGRQSRQIQQRLLQAWAVRHGG